MSDLRNDTPANVPGMNHRKTEEPADLGYPPEIERHLSDSEASQLLHQQKKEQVQVFINALSMQQVIPMEVAFSFLEDLFRNTIPMDSDGVLSQLRQNQWQQYLSPPETLEEIAHNIFLFLDTKEGLNLGNFYIATLARTTG